MIRKSIPSGHDPMGGNRFSRATNAERVCAEIMRARTRLLTDADGGTAILTPFLLILIFWLAVVFASHSLFVEADRVVVAALLAFALSISSALFLIADLSQPFAGLMQIPKEQLRHTLAPLG
jgi:hypothetical protein